MSRSFSTLNSCRISALKGQCLTILEFYDEEAFEYEKLKICFQGPLRVSLKHDIQLFELKKQIKSEYRRLCSQI